MELSTVSNLTAGISEFCVDITIIDDSLLEETELFSVLLKNAGDLSVDIGPISTANILILNNDSVYFFFFWNSTELLPTIFTLDVTVQFQQANYDELESINSIDVCIDVLGSLGKSVTLTISAQNGSAISIIMKDNAKYPVLHSIPYFLLQMVLITLLLVLRLTFSREPASNASLSHSYPMIVLRFLKHFS